MPVQHVLVERVIRRQVEAAAEPPHRGRRLRGRDQEADVACVVGAWGLRGWNTSERPIASNGAPAISGWACDADGGILSPKTCEKRRRRARTRSLRSGSGSRRRRLPGAARRRDGICRCRQLRGGRDAVVQRSDNGHRGAARRGAAAGSLTAMSSSSSGSLRGCFCAVGFFRRRLRVPPASAAVFPFSTAAFLAGRFFAAAAGERRAPAAARRFVAGLSPFGGLPPLSRPLRPHLPKLRSGAAASSAWHSSSDSDFGSRSFGIFALRSCR